ncbi:MAG: TerB family tellurite resistance protein [Gammaproteobacteria bacterium]
MSNKEPLYPTKHAVSKYNLTAPIDFDVAISYGTAIMVIAGADGELSDEEFQWFIDDIEQLFSNTTEYFEALRQVDWRKASIDEILESIHYDFPINFRRTLLYQAINMSRADGIYAEKEKASVAKAAQILGIENNTLTCLESLVETELALGRLRLSMFETDI